MGTGEFNAGDNPATLGLASDPGVGGGWGGGVEILLVTSCYRN